MSALASERVSEAGAPETETEIDVTPEMIEAGFDLLVKSGAVEHPTDSDRKVVRRMFLAMWRELRQPPSP